MDKKSIYGYSSNSPYRSAPYLDINTPEGLIDMSNTDIPLYAEDETGYAKILHPRSGMHQFMGAKVREVPIRQRGGKALKEAVRFLFEDDPPETQVEPQLPEEQRQEEVLAKNEVPVDNSDYDAAMQIALAENPTPENYRRYYEQKRAYQGRAAARGVNPYVTQTADEILGKYTGVTNLGVWGDYSHQQRVSDHNTGDAQDFGVKDPKVGSTIAEQLKNQADTRNIKYIIYNGKIWNPSVSDQWRPYSGENSHSDHIHVSFNR